MIKVVCFDFGGVYRKLRKGEHHDWKSQWKAQKKKFRWAIPFKFFAEMQYKLDTGKITLAEYYREFERKIGFRISGKQLGFAYAAVSKKQLDPDIRKLVLKLRKNGYLVPLVSNSIRRAAKVYKKKGYFKIFHPLFISCFTGASKSDGSIYKFVFRRLKVKPSECVLVDDSSHYLRQAKKNGMKTILYKNSKQLKKELIRLGVNI